VHPAPRLLCRLLHPRGINPLAHDIQDAPAGHRACSGKAGLLHSGVIAIKTLRSLDGPGHDMLPQHCNQCAGTHQPLVHSGAFWPHALTLFHTPLLYSKLWHF
jgi:hypothetical protein